MSDRNGGEPAVIIERHSGGLGSFFLGLAIGAGIALAFAPQSGDKTRSIVARKARRMKRRANRLADTARDAAEETKEAIERRLARHKVHRDEDFDGEDDGV